VAVAWEVRDDKAYFQVFASYVEDPGDGAIDDLNHYVAVGFSDDPDMGEDTVIAASFGFPDDTRSARLHYNYARRLTRTSIAVGDDTPIRNPGLRSGGGSLYASFDIPVEFSYVAPTPAGPVEVTNNLADGKYVLVASGPLDDQELSYHSVRAFSSEVVTP